MQSGKGRDYMSHMLFADNSYRYRKATNQEVSQVPYLISLEQMQDSRLLWNEQSGNGGLEFRHFLSFKATRHKIRVMQLLQRMQTIKSSSYEVDSGHTNTVKINVDSALFVEVERYTCALVRDHDSNLIEARQFSSMGQGGTRGAWK